MTKQGVDELEKLEEVRTQIQNLQSELTKTEERLKESQRKNRETKKQKDDMKEELEKVEKDIRTQGEAKQDSASGIEDSKRDYIRETVENVMKERIPAMNEDDQEDAKDEQALEDIKGDNKAEDAKASNLFHDYVLVSYYNMEKAEEYRLPYRTNKDTTIRQLHVDACAYWGCSQKDYNLFRICSVDQQPRRLEQTTEAENENKSREGVSEDKMDDNEKYESRKDIPVHKVLPLEDYAQLFLVRQSDEDNFKNKREETKDQGLAGKQQDSAKQAKHPTEGHQLSTLKAGLGWATKEDVTEPFVEALKPWPGLHHLLHTRDRSNQKWTRAALRDFCLFTLLIVLSSLGITLRHTDRFFELRMGAMYFLEGVDIEDADYARFRWNSKREKDLNGGFPHINLPEDVFNWLGGHFHDQVFLNTSALRQRYEPLGYMRIVQQRAMKKYCDRENLPKHFIRACHYSAVTAEVQSKAEIAHEAEDFVVFVNDTYGRVSYSDKDELAWQPAPTVHSELFGIIEHHYEGSGYQLVYNFSQAAGVTFKANFPFIKKWLGPTCRFMAVELLLKNYDMIGYLSVRFLFEFSPSGSVMASSDFRPFHIYQTAEESVADGLDYIRWIVVMGYVAFIRVYFETKRTSGIRYIGSFGGLLDSFCVAMFVAIQFMRLKGRPPVPLDTEFRSYAYDARVAENLMICEAFLLMALVIRTAMFSAMVPTVFRLFRMISRSAWMFAAYCWVIVPSLIGVASLAHTLWSPYLYAFSSPVRTFLTILLACRQSFPEVIAMQERQPGWTLIFVLFFFLSITVYMINAFMAIVVYSYFEVEMVENEDPEQSGWTNDQWKDWALPNSIYTRVTGDKPGASWKLGRQEAEEESDDEKSSSDSDDEK